VIVTSSEDLAAALEQEVRALPAQDLRAAALLTAKALAYFVFLRPWLYWMPQRLPQLGLGQAVFSTEFPLARPTRPQVTLAATMLHRLDAFTRARVARASALLQGLRTMRAVTPIVPVDGSAPVYLRLPLLAASEDARRILHDRLNAAGIGATASYPRSLAEVPALEQAPGARRIIAGIDVARRILTVPTHPFVGPADVSRTLALVEEATAGGVLGEVRAT
jgi:perosamine synthetase